MTEQNEQNGKSWKELAKESEAVVKEFQAVVEGSQAVARAAIGDAEKATAGIKAANATAEEAIAGWKRAEDELDHANDQIALLEAMLGRCVPLLRSCDAPLADRRKHAEAAMEVLAAARKGRNRPEPNEAAE